MLAMPVYATMIALRSSLQNESELNNDHQSRSGAPGWDAGKALEVAAAPAIIQFSDRTDRK